MDLQQLRYAVTVAETGSITAAAKKLYMGQPNLSRSIRELEVELGITLFERTARGVAPTQSGEGFLGYARSILAQMDSLEAMFRPRREPDSGLFVTAPRRGPMRAACASTGTRRSARATAKRPRPASSAMSPRARRALALPAGRRSTPPRSIACCVRTPSRVKRCGISAWS